MRYYILSRLQITVGHLSILLSTKIQVLTGKNLMLIGHCDRAFVIQYKNYVTSSLCANMEHFNFITGP